MSTHPLVVQLRFTRYEFLRGIKGVTDEEGRRRFDPMNCIAWNVGHLAWQEQTYFLGYAQRQMPRRDIEQAFFSGGPASTPNLGETLAAWESITTATDPWLDAVTTGVLEQHFTRADGQPGQRTFGSLLQRTIYHYWFHLGENMAIRQLLGHERLPQFVGNIDERAPYVPDAP